MTDRYVPVSFQEKEGGGGATLHTMLESKKWSLLVYRPGGGSHYRLLCTRRMASKLLAMPGESWETQKKYTWKGYKPTLNEINWVQGDEARRARLVDEDLGGGRKRKKTAQAEGDEDMEPDSDVERPWDGVGVYTLPLDIDADELEGFVRPDDSAMTEYRSIPGVAPSVRQAVVQVLQDEIGASPSVEQMDTTEGVMHTTLVEVIRHTELLRIEGQGSDTVDMDYEKAIASFVGAMRQVVGNTPTSLDVYRLQNALYMLKHTEKDNVVLQKGELKTLDVFVGALKPGENVEIPEKAIAAGAQMTAYVEAMQSTREGGGTVSSLVTDELGDLGSAIVREMTRLERFVSSIDNSGDEAIRYSKVNQDITRALYHRLYRQIRDMKGRTDTEDASMDAIKQFLLTRVAGGGGEELMDIEAIQRIRLRLNSPESMSIR